MATRKPVTVTVTGAAEGGRRRVQAQRPARVPEPAPRAHRGPGRLRRQVGGLRPA